MIIYHPDTGRFFRKFMRGTKETAIGVNSAGYKVMWYRGKVCPGCELMGVDIAPGYVVDHINRDRTDNRRCNLRVVVNRHNRGQTGGRQLPTGVRVTSSGKYQARIRVDGKLLSLGSYGEDFKLSIK